jgi:alkane 1-monooxygenase
VLTLVGYASEDPILSFLVIVGVLLAVFLIAEPLLGRDKQFPIEQLRGENRTSGKLGLGDVRVLLLYSLLPLQFVLIALGLYSVAYREAGPLWLIYAVPVGVSGTFSLLIAHEFMHMYSPLETALSRAAGAFEFWGVHELEHLHVHHKLDISCTEADTSYAKLGQSLYSYVALSLFHNYRNAWRTEKELLQKQNKPAYTFRNRVVRTVAISLCVAAVVWLALGGYALLFFLLQAFISLWQFLVGTYGQHYGLTRRRRADGTHEPFTYMNTWSCDFYLTNRLTVNLARHAHHHLDPFCPYYNLKLIEHSPMLPAGYLPMGLVSMIPPLWYRVMDPLVHQAFRTRDMLEQQGRL